MKALNDDIKNQEYKNFYLFFGDEDYLKKQYSNKLVNSIELGDPGMNLTKYEGKDIDTAAVIDVANTMPFFSEMRVIVIKNSGWFKKANDEFIKYTNEAVETCIIIFIESEIDKRSKLYKYINKNGRAIECNMPDPKELQIWIGNKLKNDGKRMDRNAYEEFVIRTNDNMENMSQEYEKLLCYVGERQQITKEDVCAICTKQIQSKIFDMIDGIAEKNPKKVFEIYHDLLASKEPPLKILVLIARHFRQATKIKTLYRNGIPQPQIASELKLAPFIVKKQLSMSANFSLEMMQQLLNEACTLEEDIKMGRIKDQVAVELLIMKYCK